MERGEHLGEEIRGLEVDFERHGRRGLRDEGLTGEDATHRAAWKAAIS